MVHHIKRAIHRARRVKKRKVAASTMIIAILFLAIFSYLTNPFTRFSITIDPFTNILEPDNELTLEQKTQLTVKTGRVARDLGTAKSGWHIFINRLLATTKTQATSVTGIIREIHKLRFNPNETYLISGDHFSVLYPRSLGIFYNSLLDPRTALDSEDWLNRQELYLKTTSYALSVFAKSEDLSTTIVPIGAKSVTLINIYAYPSDTLYSLLYALSVMQNSSEITNTYPFTAPSVALQTDTAAKILLDAYRDSLKQHLLRYGDKVFDPSTGLIRQDIFLSGAKDITRRHSAFYDNVIYWKTHELAQQLRLEPENQRERADLKARIISTFWLPNRGHFLEDLSSEAITNNYYSSDWLIAFMTGFLDPQDPNDQNLLVQNLDYIYQQKIDQPFGLRYHNDVRADRQYFPVNFLVPSYGSTAIWSNWGMEYTKLLLREYQVTKKPEYLTRAEFQIDAYTKNIEKYRGYPELYTANGEVFNGFFYRSVIRTGWIVSYEQAVAMLAWTKALSN